MKNECNTCQYYELKSNLEGYLHHNLYEWKPFCKSYEDYTMNINKCSRKQEKAP